MGTVLTPMMTGASLMSSVIFAPAVSYSCDGKNGRVLNEIGGC